MEKREKKKTFLAPQLLIPVICILIVLAIILETQSALNFSSRCNDCMKTLNQQVERLRNTLVYIGSSKIGTRSDVLLDLGGCAEGIMMEELRNCEAVCPNNQPICWGIKIKSECEFGCIKYTGCSGTSGQMQFVSDVDLKYENETNERLHLSIEKATNNILHITLLN